MLKRQVFCQKKHHENEESNFFFCKDCEFAICSTCAITFHEKHGKVPIQDAAYERKLRLDSTIKSQKKTAL